MRNAILHARCWWTRVPTDFFNHEDRTQGWGQ